MSLHLKFSDKPSRRSHPNRKSLARFLKFSAVKMPQRLLLFFWGKKAVCGSKALAPLHPPSQCPSALCNALTKHRQNRKLLKTALIVLLLGRFFYIFFQPKIKTFRGFGIINFAKACFSSACLNDTYEFSCASVSSNPSQSGVSPLNIKAWPFADEVSFVEAPFFK